MNDDKTLFSIIIVNDKLAFPFINNFNSNLTFKCIGPDLGRSFVVGRLNNGRYVVSKGNG